MTQDINKKLIGSSIKRHNIRYDLEIIASLIKEKTKVLDIGCGNGELLQYLSSVKNIDGRGLEISESDVAESVSKGIAVIQGNAEQDLTYYPDNSFDYAVLSQTIQAMHNPKEIVEEMLRIAKYAIISFPNFAHIKNRISLTFRGRMPVSKTIPYQWYDTPNIHFCTIKDFEALCDEMGFDICQKIYLTNRGKLAGLFDGKLFANLFAQYGIFLITKKEIAPNQEVEFAFKKKKSPSFTSAPAFANCHKSENQ